MLFFISHLLTITFSIYPVCLQFKKIAVLLPLITQNTLLFTTENTLNTITLQELQKGKNVSSNNAWCLAKLRGTDPVNQGRQDASRSLVLVPAGQAPLRHGQQGCAGAMRNSRLQLLFRQCCNIYLCCSTAYFTCCWFKAITETYLNNGCGNYFFSLRSQQLWSYWGNNRAVSHRHVQTERSLRWSDSSTFVAFLKGVGMP